MESATNKIEIEMRKKRKMRTRNSKRKTKPTSTKLGGGAFFAFGWLEGNEFPYNPQNENPTNIAEVDEVASK